MTSPPRVVLIGKPDCHLCDVARTVVETVCAEADQDFDELSVRDSPELMDRYGDYTPVVLVDGEQHDFWRISADRLRAALAMPPRPQ
ncbi:MAG: hypothetical protein QG597_1725 [Actinomycetota bacterium]|nr:hypothetical protein [Actinomycetota bacterium]